MLSSHLPQLMTYPDSLGGNLASLDRLLRDEFDGLFPGGVHVLPPFPSSGDRGFAPLRYDQIDPVFGYWSDLENVAQHGGLMLDVMVNHVSRRSEAFEDFVRHGRTSAWADLFLTLDKVWPGGKPDAADVARIFLRKPEHPFSEVVIDTGDVEQVWTSFGPRVDWSEQVDLDVGSPLVWELYEEWFNVLALHGVTTVRLDAIGYVTKRAGTSCFMVEPEIWSFFDRIADLARSTGLAVLPEVHATRSTFEDITSRGFATYNFILPGLILDALLVGGGALLRSELRDSPPNQVTMLDCHDGIPVQPDLLGVLPETRMRALVDTCIDRGANLNRVLGAPVGSFDAHQINITYADACGSDDAYLAARAIQLFAPGTPQIYYVGLLAGSGDSESMERTGDGRSINRHNYSEDEVRHQLCRPVVQRQFELIRLRGSHPAFVGSCSIPDADDDELIIEWSNGPDTCRLEVDLTKRSFSIHS